MMPKNPVKIYKKLKLSKIQKIPKLTKRKTKKKKKGREIRQCKKTDKELAEDCGANASRNHENTKGKGKVETEKQSPKEVHK